jgi:hypothetical protein
MVKEIGNLQEVEPQSSVKEGNKLGIEELETLSERDSAEVYHNECLSGTLFIQQKDVKDYENNDKDYKDFVNTGKLLIDIGDVQHFICVWKDSSGKSVLLRCNRQRIHRIDHLIKYNQEYVDKPIPPTPKTGIKHYMEEGSGTPFGGIHYVIRDGKVLMTEIAVKPLIYEGKVYITKTCSEVHNHLEDKLEPGVYKMEVIKP